jgi:hypothetical protein
MLVKTPLATLIALLAVAAAALMTIRTRLANLRADPWPAACVAISILLYGSFALTSHLNLGVRHVFPIYPLVFLIIAVYTARAAAIKPRATVAVTFLLAGLLVGECLAAYPNYIPFFNATAGGPRGGLRILGDSNLDWGQDLPLLAEWQAKHPNERLYLCYFGSADPGFYGIRYINLPSGYFMNPTAQLPDRPGVIAISATKLQGIYVYPQIKGLYDELRQSPPREILGGSIYLYDFPPPARRK